MSTENLGRNALQTTTLTAISFDKKTQHLIQ